MIHTGNNEILCPKCMTLQSAGNSSAYCEHCGSPLDIENKPYQLRPGTVLANRYIIGSVLGAGGFGITYTGWDSRLSARIAIKEYFPVGFVDRRADDGSDLTVTAGNEAAVFEKQKRRFIEEARILAKFLNDPAIVSVIDVITENNTAYTVMHLISGMNLAEYIKTYGNLTFDQAYGALRRVMLTLGRVHAAGLIHRDLSPSNIMVQEDGSLILLDFGSAREYDDENDKSMSVILKPGYAPSEQYISHGAQGPWTDVYSVCATLYKMITGVTPENSLTRMGADTLKSPSELGAVISPSQEAALLKGLNVTRGGRYSSMVELIAALDGSADAGCPDTGNVNGGYVHTENLYAGKQDPGYTDTDAGSTQMIFASSKPVVQTHTTAKVEAPKETSENVSVYGNDEETEYLFGAPMAAAVSDQSEAGQAVSAPPVKSEPVITPQPERQPAAASQPVSPSVSSTKPASAAILEKKKKKTGLIIAAVV
ncbi:MAG: serine/threonine protein kinase, partial [Lachnospiraceae bacterium]|nr:serine/threonine protein kinase [Lachnospiraceae bacterium]